MALTRDERERVGEQFGSPGWSILLRELLRTSRTWSSELLENADIPEDRRRGLVMARTAVIAGIKSCYEQAGQQLPQWLEQEFNYYHATD